MPPIRVRTLRDAQEPSKLEMALEKQFRAIFVPAQDWIRVWKREDMLSRNVGLWSLPRQSANRRQGKWAMLTMDEGGRA